MRQTVRHGAWQTRLVQLAIAVAVAGCDSDETADGSDGAGGSGVGSTTGSPSGATTGAGGDNGGSGGNGGQAAGGQGGGGECLSCKQTVEQNAPPTAACAGDSASLVGTLVTCLCQEDVCGGPDKACNAACTMGETPDEACLACDQQAAMGPCMTEFAACFADE